MLDELSKRIKKSQDFEKLNLIIIDILNDPSIPITDIANHGYCIGLFHSYSDFLYQYIKQKMIPNMTDIHVKRINYCIKWLNVNEKYLCKQFDKTLLTFEDIRNQSQYKIEFSEN